jgi:two-component system, NarL family, response regulator LiaR
VTGRHSHRTGVAPLVPAAGGASTLREGDTRPAPGKKYGVSRKPLRVAVVSRYQLTRAGLTALLASEPDRAVVFDVTDQDGHLGGSDVVIYDLAGLIDGTDNELGHLVAGGAPVVALMPAGRHDLGEDALVAGAAEVVAMEITGARLVEVLERAAARQSPSAEQRAAHRRAALQREHGLSSREMEILDLIRAGHSNQEIAATLYLSINSVKSYVRTAYRKIGVRTRSQAVLWGCQHDVLHDRELQPSLAPDPH